MTERPADAQTQASGEDRIADSPSPATRRAGTWWRVLLIVLTLTWTAAVAVVSSALAFPAVPTLGLIGMVIGGYQLQLVAVAFLGAILAVLTARLSGRWVRILVCSVAAIGVLAAVVPLVALSRTAARLGAPISVSELIAPPRNTGGPVPSRAVIYGTANGQELSLDVWLPAQPPPSGTRPAVVMIHGGGFVKGVRGETPRWNDWLNQRGYAVFDITYRLAPPARWEQAPGDVVCALSWLHENAARFQVDPEQVLLFGRSAGGALALQAAYGSHDKSVTSSCGGSPARVAAVLALFPPTDLTAWWQSAAVHGLSRTDAQLYNGGTPDQYPDRYRQASPINHIGSDLPPTLLVTGDNDHLVSASQPRAMADALASNRVPHQFVTLPFTDHDFDLSWGGLATQITRHVIEQFLHAHRLDSQSSG